MQITKIISGGQTGADRAALDWARERGIPHGGWCPKGRRAEDGVIPYSYNLEENSISAYAVRTEWNVRDSDATVSFFDRKNPHWRNETHRRSGRTPWGSLDSHHTL